MFYPGMVLTDLRRCLAHSLLLRQIQLVVAKSLKLAKNEVLLVRQTI